MFIINQTLKVIFSSTLFLSALAKLKNLGLSRVINGGALPVASVGMYVQLDLLGSAVHNCE